MFVTKLTPEVTEKVTTAIRAGVPLQTAAKYAGISNVTLHTWLGDGRNALNRAPSVEEVDPLHRAKAEFVEAVDEAMCEFKINLTGSILQHGREVWQAHAWLLERRFPDEFGRRTRIDHGNADGQPFQVQPTPVFDPSKLTDEELQTAIELLEKARPDGMKRLTQPPSELRVIEG